MNTGNRAGPQPGAAVPLWRRHAVVAMGVVVLALCAAAAPPAAALDRGKQLLITDAAHQAQLMDAVENAVWAADGSVAQKQVYVVYSTECAWSKRLYEQTRVLAGKVQLRWIVINGHGAQDVVTRRSGDSVAAAFVPRRAQVDDAARATRALDYNSAVMGSINHQLRRYAHSSTFAFPTLIYQTASGVKVVAGNPQNPGAIAAEVLARPDKATLEPAALALTASPVRATPSRHLTQWGHGRTVSAVVRSLPSAQSAPVEELAPGYLLPVAGIVADGGWIQVVVHPQTGSKGYVHDPLAARMALLDFRVKPQGGELVTAQPTQLFQFPDAESPLLDTLEPGYRFRRTGVVESGGRVWDEIVAFSDGAKGYVPR